MKATTIHQGMQALDRLAKRGLPWRFSLALGEAIHALRPVAEPIQRAHADMLREHAVQNEQGVPTVLPDGSVVIKNPKAFQADYDELMAKDYPEVKLPQLPLGSMPESWELAGEDAAALWALGVVAGRTADPEPAS
jgi:hypothetical protein